MWPQLLDFITFPQVHWFKKRKKPFGRLGFLKGQIMLPFGLLARKADLHAQNQKKYPKHYSKGYGYFYALTRSALVMLNCFAKHLFWILCRAFVPCMLTGIWLLLYIYHCSLTLTEGTPIHIYFFEWHRDAIELWAVFICVSSLMEWLNASG